MAKARYLTAKEAAQELGISPATLYAYVSRGLIRSETTGGNSRARRYRAEDIYRLRERKEQRRNPDQAMETALYWGSPLVESQITLIEEGRLYYRGEDAVGLATSHSVEQVAALIWVGEAGAAGPLFGGGEALTGRLQRLRTVGPTLPLPPMERFQVFLPLAAAEDLAAYDVRPEAVPQTGARILQTMIALAVGAQAVGEGVVQLLQAGWAASEPRAAPLLNAALVLCADHELNVSSFTARCVASAGSTPYQVVLAGLAALQGVGHGGQTLRVEAFLREVEHPAGARAAIASRLARGETIPGFGHPLYPSGDPRGAALLALVAATYPDAPALALTRAIVSEMREAIGEHPTIDLALVLLARVLGLPSGAPLTLFALGRTIGWIGHAIEQYQLDRLIRPRARYTGKQPDR